MADETAFSEETLWAFVDGEADAKTSRAILTAERRDEAFAERIRRMREENAALAEAFETQLRPPSPDLVGDVRAAMGASPRERGGSLQPFAALAASVIVAVGLGAVFAEWRLDSRLASLEAQERAQSELVSQLMQQALERRLSGEAEAASLDGPDFSAQIKPTKTYRSRSGHWCRSFEESLEIDGQALSRTGVACRVDGGWRRLETTIEGEPKMERL